MPKAKKTISQKDMIAAGRILADLMADYQDAQKDCWNYHKDLLREINESATTNTCDNVVMDLDMGLEEYDDLYYYAGYFRGLNAARDIIMDYEAE